MEGWRHDKRKTRHFRQWLACLKVQRTKGCRQGNFIEERKELNDHKLLIQ